MRWVKIAIVGVLLAAALLIFFGMPANFIVGKVKSRIEAETGYRLRLDGQTTLSFWPDLTISMRGVALSTNDAPAEDRLAAERISAVLSLHDLWHGHTHVTELTVSRPKLHVPLPRERIAAPSAPAPAAESGGGQDSPTIDRIVVEDGTIDFYGQSGRNEGQIGRVNLQVEHVPSSDGASVKGSFAAGAQPVDVDMQLSSLPQRFDGQAIPVAATFKAPGYAQEPIKVSAELLLRNATLAINRLSARSGPNGFDGFATVDFRASKPMVKADLEFNRLQLGEAAASSGSPAGQGSGQHPIVLSAPWSNQPYNLDVLNFFDAQMRLSASDIAMAAFHLAPGNVDLTINKGALQIKFANASLYGGTANGVLSIDAAPAVPTQALNVQLAGVSALPLLTDIAEFDSLEGALAANIDVHATGNSQQATVSSLAGTVDFHLSNGDVRGIDLTKLMHNIVDTILNGWQWNANDKTPLTDFSSHFTLANGVATTDDLTLTGPVVQMTGAGTINIADKTLQARVEPKLVVAQQNAGAGTSAPSGSGQAAGSNGGGLSVPIRIEGSWSAPRISPEMGGMLSQPGALLNQLGGATGLFGGGNNGGSGNGGSGGSGNSFDSLIGGFGNMLKGSGQNGGGLFGGGK